MLSESHHSQSWWFWSWGLFFDCLFEAVVLLYYNVEVNLNSWITGSDLWFVGPRWERKLGGCCLQRSFWEVSQGILGFPSTRLPSGFVSSSAPYFPVESFAGCVYWLKLNGNSLQAHQGKWSEAVQSLQHAIRGFPTCADLWEVLSWCLLSRFLMGCCFLVLTLFSSSCAFAGLGSCLRANGHVYCCSQGHFVPPPVFINSHYLFKRELIFLSSGTLC